MKALAKVQPRTGLQLIEVPPPTAVEGVVVMRPRLVSICGSDLPIYAWNDLSSHNVIVPAQIIGHEFVGEVVEIGPMVTDICVGDTVTAEARIFCGHCHFCTMNQRHLCANLRQIGFSHPGAFAERVSAPASNVIKVDGLDDEIASILDPIGNAVHALSKANIAGKHVLVNGCGPLGLITIAIAKHMEPKTILALDNSSYRLGLAEKLGAVTHAATDYPSTFDWVKTTIQNKYGADVLFEMSGSAEAIGVSCSLLKSGGEAVLMGLPDRKSHFNFTDLVVCKELTIRGVMGREIPQTWDITLSLMTANPCLVRDLRLLLTHRISFKDFEHGFELMFARACGKVLIKMTDPL